MAATLLTMTPEPQSDKTEQEPFEVRAEKLLARVFRGMHHVYSLKKERDYWTCITNHVSTYDFDELTRLVLAAHEYCCRVEIRNGGPLRLKIFVSPRIPKTDDSNIFESHPTIEQAIEKWRKS